MKGTGHVSTLARSSMEVAKKDFEGLITMSKDWPLFNTCVPSIEDPEALNTYPIVFDIQPW